VEFLKSLLSFKWCFGGGSTVTIEKYSLSGEYTIETITDFKDFKKLKTVWDALLDQDTPYMPYLCFDWFNLWLEHFLNGDELLVLLLYKGDQVVTIAPFLIKKGKFKGINVRKIELIGNVYSPIQFFLFNESKTREKNLYLILTFLSKIYRRWDVIDLNPIPVENEDFYILNNSLDKTSLKNSEYFCFGNWYLNSIDYPSSTYFANLSKKQKKNIRLYKNRADKAGKVIFKMITNPDDIETYMKTYFNVYEKSWKKRERVGPDFHMDLTKQIAEKGWFRLGLVFLDDVSIVAGFAIVCNGIAYFEKTAYDEDYKELGAGYIWFAEMIKHIIDIDKVKTIDFLRGDHPYKRHWVQQRRERKGVLVFNNNLKGNFLHLLIEQILPAFRQNQHLNNIKGFISKNILKSDLR
jgi:CelD/BcsL family acetyltransferase involved in cellulose biosynthesis